MIKASHPRHSAAVLLLYAALIVALPAAAQTQFFGGGQSRAEASGFGQQLSLLPDQQSASGALPVGTVSSARQALLGSGAGSVLAAGQTTALPAIGGLHLTAHALARVLNGDTQSAELAQAVADTSGLFSDFFRLDVPGYAPGSLFTVTAGMRIDAMASAEGAASNNAGSSTFGTSASWDSTVSLTPSIGGVELTRQSDSLTCTADPGGSACTGSGAGWRILTFQMPNQSWQAQLNITGRARTTARVYLAGGGNGLATGHSDLGHTIAWGGISGLVDASGAAVSSFSAISATSGFDYRNAYVSAVPEPAQALLLLAGMLVLAWLIQRRADR